MLISSMFLFCVDQFALCLVCPRKPRNIQNLETQAVRCFCHEGLERCADAAVCPQQTKHASHASQLRPVEIDMQTSKPNSSGIEPCLKSLFAQKFGWSPPKYSFQGHRQSKSNNQHQLANQQNNSFRTIYIYIQSIVYQYIIIYIYPNIQINNNYT